MANDEADILMTVSKPQGNAFGASRQRLLGSPRRDSCSIEYDNL